MPKKDWVFSMLVIFFLLSFFLPVLTVLKTISMSLLLAWCCVYPSRLPQTGSSRTSYQVLFMTAFAGWLLLSFFYSDDRQDFTKFLILRLPLLLFPLTLGAIRFNLALRNKLLLIFSFIVLTGCFASLVYAVYQRVNEGHDHWLFNDSLSFFIRQQSVYTSLLVNIAIYSLGYTLIKNSYPRYKGMIIGSILFLLVFSFMLASRNLMAILYLVILITIFYQAIIGRKFKLLIGFAVVLVTGLLAIFLFSPKTLNRFKELAFTSYQYRNQGSESHYASPLTAAQWNGANFRLAAWSCGWQLALEHPLIGTGLGDKRTELNRIYRERDFQFALKTKKNVHNNYLDILFSLGLTGLILFLAGWIVLPAVQFIRNKDLLAIACLGTLFTAMITEVYFDRSLGAMLFAFFVTFLSAGSSKLPTDQ